MTLNSMAWRAFIVALTICPAFRYHYTPSIKSPCLHTLKFLRILTLAYLRCALLLLVLCASGYLSSPRLALLDTESNTGAALTVLLCSTVRHARPSLKLGIKYGNGRFVRLKGHVATIVEGSRAGASQRTPRHDCLSHSGDAHVANALAAQHAYTGIT